MPADLLIRRLGRCGYEPTWRAMQRFTDKRDDTTIDELWQVEHPPVFTLGMNGKKKHILAAGDIPVVPIDRGGQVTYHGPGQALIYLLLDIKRRKFGVRHVVEQMERAIIKLLADYEIGAYGRRDAPGVYVKSADTEQKIAALGLRIRRGCSYHGLALNVDMALEPYQRINPCGYAGMAITQMAEFCTTPDIHLIQDQLCQRLAEHLDYSPSLLEHTPS